jgi:hypothetical protein
MSTHGVAARMTSPSRLDSYDREGGDERGAELTTDWAASGVGNE